MSSGGGKKKMSTKMRWTTTTSKLPQHGETVTICDDSIGHTVIRPSKESRALVMRAQRAMLEAGRKKAAAARSGNSGALQGGQVLGGSASMMDVRAARLLHLEKPKAPQPPLNSASRARRRAFEEEHGDDVSSEVLLLLDLAGERLQSRAEPEQMHRLLCTVLRNASTKGVDDPKYLTLRGQNDKLWEGLLRHPEMRAVLGAAGFEWRQPEALQRAAGEQADASAVVGDTAPAAAAALSGKLPSFVESDFATLVEYRKWMAAQAGVGARAQERDEIREGRRQRQQQQEPSPPQQSEPQQTQRSAALQAETLMAQLALHEQLAAVEPDPDAVRSLLSRLEDLSQRGSGHEGLQEEATPPGDESARAEDSCSDDGDDDDGSDGSGEDDSVDERDFELVLRAADDEPSSLEDLEAVLAAAAVWCFDPAPV